MFCFPKQLSDTSDLQGSYGGSYRTQVAIVLVEDTGAMILNEVRVLADSPVPAVLRALDVLIYS